MRKAFKISVFASSVVVQITIFIFATVLIFAVSYIVGYRYLLGNTFWGNDSFSYFSVVDWFNKYFPKVPFWFPLQGGGVSLFAGYPWFAAFIVIVTERLSQFNLIQSFRLVGFLSVPITAVGVFTLAWARLTDVKPVWMRQVIGLIAALLYAVSPIAWIWLTRWGFYSENVSHMFIPWAILFFDIFLDRLVEEKRDFVFRFSLFLSLLFLTLGTLTHFFVAVGLIPIFGILVLTKFKKIKKLILPLVLFGVLYLGLFAFRLYPYQKYNKEVAKGGFSGYAAPSQASYQETAKNMLPPKMMLSLEAPKYEISDFISFSRSTIADMNFPFYVWVLTVPALLFSFFKSKKIFLLSIYNVLGFLLNSFVGLRIFLGEHLGPFSFLLTLTTGRVYFITMAVIIPILAGYGAYIIWGVISDLLSKLLIKVKLIYFIFYPFQIFAILMLTLGGAGYSVFRWYNLPYNRVTANVGAFNDKLDLRDIWHKMPTPNYTIDNTKVMDVNSPATLANFDYMNSVCLKYDASNFSEDHICSYFWKREGLKALQALSVIPPDEIILEAKKNCKVEKDDYCQAFYRSLLTQLEFSNWEKFYVSSDVSGELTGLIEKFKELPASTPYRFDMSGYTGRYIMATPLVTGNSLIQSYINTLSLIYNLWNYQSQSMYTQFSLYQKPQVLSEIARWFGINYVFLTGSLQEPLEDYMKDDNFQKLSNSPDGWMEFKESLGIYSWDERPRVLVISDNSKYFYDQTFKFFTWGGLPYGQAIPVMGKKEVDGYSLSELKKFDAIFMRGYDYKFKAGAYNLLDRYIREGGKLIFDTGWQYLIPDWQIEKAPSFMPFESLVWKNLPTDSSFKIEDPEIAKEVDAASFGPLIWENQSWGVSVPNKIKPWAKTILSYSGEPLTIVGNYGRGSVAWFGFNIVPHAEAKDSLSEIYFFSKTLENYILGQNKEYAEFDLSYERVNPDKMIFRLNREIKESSNLYFRESYYPDWKAKLISGKKSKNLKVYRAGPGFMLIDVPSGRVGDEIILEIVKPKTQILAEIISALIFMGLVIYIFIPGVSKFPKINLPKFRKMTFKIPKFNNDEDDY